MTDKNDILKDVTHDTLYDGRMYLGQPANGYRVSVDSLLLTYFATKGKPSRLCVDLGAGCGVVGIGLLLCEHVKHVTAVEVQSRLADLATVNAQKNGLSARYHVVQSDIRHLQDAVKTGSIDLVISNPPFWPAQTGKPPIDEERRIACQETLGNVQDWTDAASRIIHQRKGRFVGVFPCRRLDEILISLKESNLSCRRICFVHPVANREAEVFLFEARWGKPGRTVVETPIFLKTEDGDDTDISSSIFSGCFSNALRQLPDRRTT